MKHLLLATLLSQPLLESQGQALSSELVAEGLSQPIYVTSHPQNAEKLFVLEQKGMIKIIQDGKVLRDPFLDITDRVHRPRVPGDERGLLGLAFHPDYDENGYFFVNYVNEDDYSIISRFQAPPDPNRADRESEKILVKLKQPFSNHNGGHLAFGPHDNYLYIALGDGGKWGDPYNHAQSLDNLFGKILRIDVDRGNPYGIPPDNPFAPNSEIWVYGLRNPWRFSFDRVTGDLYIGDVGQDGGVESTPLTSPRSGKTPTVSFMSSITMVRFTGLSQQNRSTSLPAGFSGTALY